jgi:hypothetical protein
VVCAVSYQKTAKCTESNMRGWVIRLVDDSGREPCWQWRQQSYDKQLRVSECKYQSLGVVDRSLVGEVVLGVAVAALELQPELLLSLPCRPPLVRSTSRWSIPIQRPTRWDTRRYMKDTRRYMKDIWKYVTS